MIRRFAMTAGLLLMLALPLVTASGTAMAAPTGAQDAAQFCQYLAQTNSLDEFFGSPGATVGDCINLLRGPASQQANNFIAGVCSLDFVQEYLGTTNKGQCIQVIRSYNS